MIRSTEVVQSVRKAILARIASLEKEVCYWRRELKRLEASSAADMAPGPGTRGKG